MLKDFMELSSGDKLWVMGLIGLPVVAALALVVAGGVLVYVGFFLR